MADPEGGPARSDGPGSERAGIPATSGHVDDRYRRGLAALRELHHGDRGVDILQRVAELAPDLARFVVEFAYGDIYARPGLSPRDRQLVTVAVLAALGGCEPLVRVHTAGALEAGVTAGELVELVLHLVPYVGFPRAMNAMDEVRAVFEEEGIRPGPRPAAGP